MSGATSGRADGVTSGPADGIASGTGAGAVPAGAARPTAPPTPHRRPTSRRRTTASRPSARPGPGPRSRCSASARPSSPMWCSAPSCWSPRCSLLAVVPGVNIARGVTSGDPTSPLDVGLALAMGAMWAPAGIVGVRVGGWRPLGTAWSVAARLRPDRPLLIAGAGGGLAVVVLAALAGMLAGAPDAAGSGASIPRLLLVVPLVLVLAPRRRSDSS
ncbi:hypothetical protein [Brachybacterium sp. GPGPB12]|uniref:hypothetical protein n=1 Tax=Brachybacterium sp. GPGPB12 TaxID=3023517 RepID=UPI0031345B18